MTDVTFWLEPLESLKERLGAGVDGLSATEMPARLRQFGPNRDQEAVEKGLLRLILRRALEPMSLLLVFAALVSAGTGDAVSAGIILVISDG